MAQVPALCGRRRVESSPLFLDKHQCTLFLDWNPSLTLAEPLRPCCPQMSLQHAFAGLSEMSVDTQVQLGGRRGRCPQHGKGDGNEERGKQCITGKILLVRLVVSLRCKTESPQPGLGWAPLLFCVSSHRHCRCPIRSTVIEKWLWGEIPASCRLW